MILLLIAPPAGQGSTVRWEVAPGSRATLRVEMGPLPVEGHLRDTGQGKGLRQAIQGYFLLDGSAGKGTPRVKGCELNLAVANVTTPVGVLSEWLHSPALLDSRTHPTARFHCTRVAPLSQAGQRLEGWLTVKGQRRKVSFPVRLSRQAGTLQADGAIGIRRRDFAIEGNRLDALLGERAEIVFTLRLRR